MIEYIYASKLYRSSKRKNKIQAALNNPLNNELIGQLADALGEEYQTPEYLSKKHEHKGKEESDIKDTRSQLSDEDDIPSARSNSGLSHGSSSNTNNMPKESSEHAENKQESNSQEAVPQGENNSSTSKDVPITDSFQVSGSTVFGSFPRSPFKNMQQVSDQLKGMLNLSDATKGVNRILHKEDEVWIYYNDDMNLNNVMSDVIELINASGYTFLEFNRLARSENAIVFQADFVDTNNKVNPVKID